MSAMASTYMQGDPSRRYRGMAVVIAVHVMLGWALLSGTAQKTIAMLKKPLEAVVIQEVVIPPAPVPEPPKPKEVRQPEVAPPKMVQPVPVVEPSVPAPNVVQFPEPAPEPLLPIARPVVEAPTAVMPPPTPHVDPMKERVASMEGEYIVKLRAMLNASKRYPTGRQASQQHPHGVVKVWFILARNGALMEAGLLQSSDSYLLDDAALASVRRGTYPAFPEHTWAGQESHKFTADMEFASPNSG